MKRYLLVFIVLLPLQLQAQPQWQQATALESLNSSSDDCAPCWNNSSNTLIFTSMRSGVSKLWSSDSSMAQLKPFTLFHQKPSMQYAFCTMSQNGLLLCSMFHKSKRQAVANIASSRLSNGVWSDLEFETSFISDRFTSHPSISPSGSTIVFVSDREGGEGGTDLWICSRNGPVWGAAINMGEVLNSAADEITPFLASDDTLYYSSNGFGGRGGFDVFMSIRVAGEWQTPLPLNSINTSFDDSDFIILPNRDAIFASNRNGAKGGLDLFRAPALK